MGNFGIYWKHIIMTKLLNVSSEERQRILEMHNPNERTIKEDVNNAQVTEASKKFFNCFNAKDYPNLNEVSKGSVRTVLGLYLCFIGAASEAITFGLSSVPSIAAMAMGSAETVLGIKNLYDANISKIGPELRKLKNCISPF